MSELYGVSSPYFDGDHDHGEYSIGPFSSVERAKAAAEILADHRYDPGQWKWVESESGGLPHIETTDDGWEYGQDCIWLSLLPVDPEITSENVGRTLNITYT